MLQRTKQDSLITPGAQKRSTVVAIVASVVALAMASGIGFFVWHQSTEAARTQALAKNIRTVHRGSIDVRVTATGTVRPFNQVKLSPKFTGLLKNLYVQQGHYVKAGQVIALMDDSNFVGQELAAQAGYESARAAYEKNIHGNRPQELLDAEAQMRKAQAAVQMASMMVNHTRSDLVAMQAQVNRDLTNEKRCQILSTQGAISDQDFLNAQTAATVSSAQLKRTQDDLHQVEASLTQAKAEAESARQKYLLTKEGFRTEDIKAAQQAMLQAKGNLEYVQSQRADCKIVAPFDGVVTQKYADRGAIVAPTTSSNTNSATSSSIVSLAGRLEMVAAVAETDIDHIHVGQNVAITAPAYPTETFRGKVTLIAPEAIVTQNVTSFEVHTTIDDPKHRLMSGMNVNAEFVGGSKDGVLLIPTSCVVTKKGRTGVFVPDEHGDPMFKPVKIGTTSDSDTVVNSGLKEGDKIFVSLSKEQLTNQGYTERSILAPPSKNGKGGDSAADGKAH